MVTQRFITYWQSHKHEVYGLCALSAIIYTVISMITYHPYDPTLFFYTTDQSVVHNWGGIVGAYIAGFLIFLFGNASYIAIGTLLYGVVLLFKNQAYTIDLDRAVAWGCFILVTAGLWSVYPHGDPSLGIDGGLVGMYLSQVLVDWFDVSGAYIFLYTALMVSSMMLFRVSLVYALQSVSQRMAHGIMYVYKKQLLTRGVRMSLAHGYYLTSGCAVVLRAGVRLLSKEVWHTAHDLMIDNGDDAYISPTFSYESVEPCAQDDQIIAACAQDSMASDEQEPASCAKKTYEQSNVFSLPTPRMRKKNNYHEMKKAQQQEQEDRAQVLQEKLARFGITGTVLSIKQGPVVTLFEYQPAIDMKLSKILALEDDLAMALRAISIRILAPIPGTAVVGFEVANEQRMPVLLTDVLQSSAFKQRDYMLPLVLGHSTVGDSVVVDLARMPHLLVAGSTGSGKSVGLNTMLMSLLCTKSPDELKLILIDPKRLEFSAYDDIAHLLFPIVTDPKRAVRVLKWVVQEMERRYDMMAESGGRNIDEYNSAQQAAGNQTLPFIVVVIDELADLMMTTGKEIEDLIARTAQMARAAGIHMIVATQRPSVDVITGLIKVNFPSRIAFRVTSKVDSRTILDTQGAERLLGSGDMLFLHASHVGLQRIHGAYASQEDVAHVTEQIRTQVPPTYETLPTYEQNMVDDITPEDDELLQHVRAYLQEIDDVSISLLQRRFKIGYNRSARIIDILESQGYISSSQGGKTRKVVRDLT